MKCIYYVFSLKIALHLPKYFLVFKLTVLAAAMTLSAARVKSTATISSHLWKKDLNIALSTPAKHTVINY